MSRRTIRDYIASAFIARDKATVDAIIKDAEKAGVDPDDHAEPDGDEGDTHVHLHLTKNGDARVGDNTDPDADPSVAAKLKNLDARINGIDAKLTKITDAITRSAKDGDLPPWLKKDGDDDKNGDGDGDKTEDAGELGGEEGAQTAQKLTSAEPDLMEADPALSTGPSKMGDAAYVDRVGKALAKLVKDTRSRAEILVPGIKFATIDAAPKEATAKLLCDIRRHALTKASTTDAGKRLLGRYTADAIKGLSCEAVRLAFLDASDRARDANNGQGRSGAGYSVVTVDKVAFRQGQSAILRTINERNRAHWEKQMGRPN